MMKIMGALAAGNQVIFPEIPGDGAGADARPGLPACGQACRQRRGAGGSDFYGDEPESQNYLSWVLHGVGGRLLN